VAGAGVGVGAGAGDPSWDPLEGDRHLGLGWDSLAQEGLAAVGIRAWRVSEPGEGPGSPIAGTLLVAPDERLGVAVVGGARGAVIEGLAERLLFQALVERGRLPALPPALDSIRVSSLGSPPLSTVAPSGESIPIAPLGSSPDTIPISPPVTHPVTTPLMHPISTAAAPEVPKEAPATPAPSTPRRPSARPSSTP